MAERFSLEFDVQVEPQNQALWEIAREYHRATESFDKAICKARNERGVAIPVTRWEIGECSRNALRWSKRTYERAALLGFTSKQTKEALHATAREFD